MPVSPITKTPGQSGYDEELKAFSQSIADGLLFQWKGQWATPTIYDENDGVYNNGSGYACILAHTSDATTEPGTGASWETYWSVMVAAGDMQKSIYDPTNKNGDAFDADNHAYSNATSGLAATNTQAAIDELAGELVPSAMAANIRSKAEVEAEAARRMEEMAGSGFVKFGVNVGGTNYDAVNLGMGARAHAALSSTWANTFFLSSSSGDEPEATVNWYKQKIIGIPRISDGSTLFPFVTLPPAPGATNPNLVTNGTFDTDTTGWGIRVDRTVLSVVSGEMKVENIGSGFGYAYQAISTVVGKKYALEMKLSSNTPACTVRVGDAEISGTVLNVSETGTGYFKYEFTADATTTYISFTVGTATVGDYFLIDNVAVIPADEISRQDLVFLETWHEKVTDLDFVFPYGNVQYAGAEQTGMPTIATAAFTGYDTYSLFGNWQTAGDLVGKGHVWSALDPEFKALFVSIHENNCYLDGTDVIQIRYRVRVVQGLGDEWENVYSSYNIGLRYNSTFYVKPKGKLTTGDDLSSATGDGYYWHTAASWSSEYDVGIFPASNTAISGLNTTVAHEGKCFALPIALVSRRNQGGYHPAYNPNGTQAMYWNNGYWYEANNVANLTGSIRELFDAYPSGIKQNGNLPGGYIGATSYRPDGLYYDEINERDIIDQRSNAKPIKDQARYLQKSLQNSIAGTQRADFVGDGEWETVFIGSGDWAGEATFAAWGAILTGIQVSGDVFSHSVTEYIYGSAGVYADELIQINDDSGQFYKVVAVRYTGTNTYFYLHPYYGDVTANFSTGNTYDILVSEQSNKLYGGTKLHCDVIGDPANYPSWMTEAGFMGTPLLVGEEGENYVNAGAITVKLSRKMTAQKLWIYSTDSGATWSVAGSTFSTTTNAQTVNTNNIHLVFYETYADPTESAANAEVLSGAKELWYGNRFSEAALVQGLTGKVLSNNVAGEDQYGYMPLTKVQKFSDGKLYSDRGGIAHNTIGMYGANPAVKVLPYLSRENGRAYLYLLAKEMVYDVTWGDDNTFDVVDNVSTTTDDNGNTVLICTKRIPLNRFIGDAE